jgi:formiminoglutamase
MLENFLQPIPPNQFNEMDDLELFQLGRNISIYFKEEAFPNLEEVQIAIIGAGKKEANEVRQALYRLSFPFKYLKIVDLGNLRKATTDILTPVVKELLDSNILPIIIGNQQQLTISQYQGYSLREQLANMVLVDKAIDFTFDKVRARRGQYFLNKILGQEKSYLLHLSLIGYQKHFVNPQALQLFQEQQFDYVRLGHIKDNMEELEPMIRDADFLSFDMSTVRQSDAPASLSPSPSGLFAEQACKIAHYAGLSDKLTSIGFYDFNQSSDRNTQTAHLIAQMIWYFLDGYANRKGDYPFSQDSMVEYVVDFKTSNYQISFWKSTRSDRWWMQIPVKDKKYERHRLVPCSYSDYQLAAHEELPERLLNAYTRF